MTINPETGPATITAPSGGNGITINAGPTDSVNIKGLSIDGSAGGYDGIVINSAGSVTITNTTIRHFSGNPSLSSIGTGIFEIPTSGYLYLHVTNSILSDNGYAGLAVVPTSGNAFINTDSLLNWMAIHCDLI